MMKKVLVLLAVVGFVAGSAGAAYALPIQWDVSAAGSSGLNIPDADTLTGIFDQFGFASQTSTVQYDTDGSGDLSVGDKFVDSGNLRMGSLIAGGSVDEEGLGITYEVTGIWNNLEGVVTGVSVAPGGDTQIDTRYLSGTIDLYLDTELDSAFEPGGVGAGGTGFGDDTDGDDTAIKIATLSLTDGVGHTFVDFGGGNLDNQGSVDLAFDFTYVLPGFWLDKNGVDLLSLVQNNPTWILGFTDMNIDTPTFDPGVPAGALYTAKSNQNGSGNLDVVPEPASMLLLGTGLLGMVGIGRKKRIAA